MKLNPQHWKVYDFCYKHQRDFISFPSLALIAEFFGVSRVTANTWVHELIEAKAVTELENGNRIVSGISVTFEQPKWITELRDTPYDKRQRKIKEQQNDRE